MRFLRHIPNILTVKPWMGPALQARVGRYSPGPREFFTEVDYRDPAAGLAVHATDVGAV